MKSTNMQEVNSQEDFERIISGQLPPPTELLDELSKFHSLLYDALGNSLARTNEVLKQSHNKMARMWITPQLIRYFVHDFLGQKGIKSHLVNENDEEEGENTQFEPKVLPGNGVSGIINSYPYRMLKKYKFGNGLPPAVSQRRKDLYDQSHLKSYSPPLPGFPAKNNFMTCKPNLIYLWDTIRNRAINLYLAIPTNSLLYMTTELINIPNPITSIKPEKDVNEVLDETLQKSFEILG